MDGIEFRGRRSDDELEPWYVRIAERGDGRALAFTETTDDRDELRQAIAVVRAGEVDVQDLHDRGNDVWFYRLVSRASGDVVFRSMPCPSQEALQAEVAALLADAPTAPFVDETDEL